MEARVLQLSSEQEDLPLAQSQGSDQKRKAVTVQERGSEELPHVQGQGGGREELPHVQGKRNPSKTAGTERGHQRADPLKP